MSNNAKNTMKHSENTTLTCFDSQQLTSNGEMSWTYTVYNFADDLHWPELGILLESIDYHEAARKASFLGSMCEDSLMAAIHFERRFDALMKYLINSQEHPIGKVKDFIYRVEFKMRGSYHYLATAYFFWIANTPHDISCDTRDVLVQYINSVTKTDIPDELDVELYQKCAFGYDLCVMFSWVEIYNLMVYRQLRCVIDTIYIYILGSPLPVTV